MELYETSHVLMVLAVSILPLSAHAYEKWAEADIPLTAKTVYTQHNAPSTPPVSALSRRTSVTRDEITWHFESPVPIGRFVNGDPYVVGPCTITRIDPKPLWGGEVSSPVNKGEVRETRYLGSLARNGSTLNPPSSDGGGFDSRLIEHWYQPSLFVHLPLRFTPGNSLVSTISCPEPLNAYNVHARIVERAVVLTCLAEPVPPDAFRPSFRHDVMKETFLARNLNRDKLMRLAPPVPIDNLDEWTRRFQRPWLDRGGFGRSHPKQNLPEYGQSIAFASSMAGLLLHIDIPDQEKEPLLINFVQRGIDLYGTILAAKREKSGLWASLGGHGDGRKLPLLFAGTLLDHQGMSYPRDSYEKVQFGEDVKTFAALSWTGADAVFQSHPHKLGGEMVGLSETRWPSMWNEYDAQSDNYRRCCTSVGYGGQALAAMLLGCRTAWSHEPFFVYADRWMTEDNRNTRKVAMLARSSMTEAQADSIMKRDHSTDAPAFVAGMWNAHRKRVLPLPPVSRPANVPPAGTYLSPLTIEVHCFTEEASVFYTTDGTTPTVRSSRSQGPLTLSTTTRLRALCVHPTHGTSASVEATYTLMRDTEAPRVTRAWASPSDSRIDVLFSEPLEKNSAKSTVNYSLLPDGIATAAELSSDSQTVILTVRPLQPGVAYTLSVSGVADVRGNTVDKQEIKIERVPAAPTEGLIAQWTFDRIIKDSVVDESWNGNGAKLVSTESLIRDNRSVMRSEPTGWLACGFSPFTIDSTNAFTILMQIKPEKHQGVLVARGYVHPFSLAINADGTLKGIVRGSSGTRYLHGKTSLTLNTWHTIALSCASGAATLHIDGTLDATAEVSVPLVANIQSNTKVGQGFAGDIDEVRIYNRAVTDEERRLPIRMSWTPRGIVRAGVASWSGGSVAAFTHWLTSHPNAAAYDVRGRRYPDRNRSAMLGRGLVVTRVDGRVGSQKVLLVVR